MAKKVAMMMPGPNPMMKANGPPMPLAPMPGATQMPMKPKQAKGELGRKAAMKKPKANPKMAAMKASLKGMM